MTDKPINNGDHKVLPMGGRERRSGKPGRREKDIERVKILSEIFDTFQNLDHPCKNPGCGHLPCRWTRRIGAVLGKEVKTFETR